MDAPSELLTCPLCDFTVHHKDDYVLQLHFEQVHTIDSPFRIEGDPGPAPPPLPKRPSSALSANDDQSSLSSSQDEGNTVMCPEPDCGETVLLNEFNDHLSYHAAETLSFDETTRKYHSRKRTKMHSSRVKKHHAGSTVPSFYEQDHNAEAPEGTRRHHDARRRTEKKPRRGRSDTASSEKSTLSRTMETFNPFSKADKKVKPPSSSCRLGRAELGPYAWEDRMPSWLHDQLAAGAKITVINRIGRDGRLIKQERVQNETPGIIPILAQLSALDRTVKEAYYCHPSTLHIGKTPKEGGFCGYRNCQMLISYIQGARAQGHEEFPGRSPGILKLQDMIERAWDKGINSIGRQQTGGIRDTRKYIGTPEAQALFLSSQIDCAVQMFSDASDGSTEAHESLLTAVEVYFSQAAVDDGSNVHKTLLPPIYLQQPGHSITIVGLERRRDGTRNLLIFDPMYSTSPAMHKLIGRKDIRTPRPEVLHAYRRVARQLKKHAAFEILMLTAHPPLFPAWDVLRQFPGCRFLYVFFRSRTLGFDVYPEDHFLRNFPWQQYGGLWIVDDARFARSDNLNPITSRALRRITAEGATSGTSQTNSSLHTSSKNTNTSQAVTSRGQHFSGTLPLCDLKSMGQTSLMDSYDGTESRVLGVPQDKSASELAPVLDMIGMHTSTTGTDMTMPPMQQVKLSLLTEIGRMYPGYPNPLSPSLDAQNMFPSPASDNGSGLATPQAKSPISRIASPVSADGSEAYAAWRKIASGLASYVAPNSLANNQELVNELAHKRMAFLPAAKIGGMSPRSASPAVSLSPDSPVTALSPRSAMLKSMIGKHALHSLSHRPSSCPPVPAIPIANGLETSTVSPLSSSGTLLSYTSNRGVDSGLLAVRPLSEAQVAEYRFWRPCGKGSCAFGCGGGREGEIRAARCLFRDVDEVDEDKEEEE